MVMKKGIVLAFGVIVLASCESKEEKAFKASIESRISVNEKSLEWCKDKLDSIRPYYLENISHHNYPSALVTYNYCQQEINTLKMQIEEDKKYLYK